MAKTAELKDRFDGIAPSLWLTYSSPSIVNGQAVFTASGGEGNYLSSYQSYALTDSYVQVELVGIDIKESSGMIATILNVTQIAGDGYHYGIQVREIDGVWSLAIHFYNAIGTGYYSLDPYNAETDKYFKIKHTSPYIYFQKSADGKTWTNIISPFDDTDLDVDDVKVILAVSGLNSETMTLDNFNIPVTPEVGESYPLPSFSMV